METTGLMFTYNDFKSLGEVKICSVVFWTWLRNKKYCFQLVLFSAGT